MTDRNDILTNWDALNERPARVQPGPTPQQESNEDDPGPPLITLMATSWADLVGMLAVCTGALIAILILGERPTLPAFAWQHLECCSLA